MRYTFYIKSAFLCEPIGNVKISAIDTSGNILHNFFSDQSGYFEFLDSDKIDYLIFEKSGYIKKIIPFDEESTSIIRLLEDKLIGYQNKVSFNPGEKVSVFINSSSDYEALLIRHGDRNETIKDLGVFHSSLQQVPDKFFVEYGLSWNLSFEYVIPVNAIPGLYSLKLIPKTENQKPYFLTFVVSTKSYQYGKKSKLLVLVSSNNWQTYNIWGGRSRYRNFEFLKVNDKKYSLRILWIKYMPESIKDQTKKLLRNKFPITSDDAPSVHQFKRLSVYRPHPNCSIEDDDPYKPFTSHLAASEWRLLAWLEKNNFDYDIVSGFDLHKDPKLLRNYSAFILSSHCEYWSKEMYNGLKDYFTSGGSILNLSGNSIYREIEFFDDGSLRCVSLRFSESVADESEVIGVRFDMRGYGTCAPYKILKPDHWTFAGLNVSKGNIFGDKSLNQPTSESQRKFESNPAASPGLTKLTGNGASGWETDKITKTAPKDITLIAKGMNGKKGGADMIIRERTNEHGLLFSASSITFAGSILQDITLSGIVKNVLKKVLK